MKFSRRFGSTGGKSKENNKLVFDLETDLTPLFNWNTKQVFVYLTAEYPGQTENSTNKVTYWDKIIQSKDKAKLNIKNERSKYSAWDVEPTFNNKEATVKLEWNIQPWVGPLVFGETAGESILTYPSPPEGNKEKLRKEKKNKQN
jgi:signal peptidase complex subunit 3